jgi:hypothetical protein
LISAAAAGGLVAAHRLAEIVVVRRVRRRAIEKGGIERRGLWFVPNRVHGPGASAMPGGRQSRNI